MPARGPLALRASPIAALHTVAIAAASFNDECEIARLIVEQARLMTRGDAAVLRRFDAATDSFKLLASAGVRSEPEGEIDAASPTGIGEAFSAGRPVITNSYTRSGRTTPWGLSEGIRAQVAVPLVADGRPVGTLAVLSHSPHRFSHSDALAMTLMAAIVAPALEASRLTAQLEVSKAAQKDVEELFSGAFQASGLGMALVDVRGTVVRANPALCSLLGYSIRDLVGVDGRILVAVEDAGLVMARAVQLAGMAEPSVIAAIIRLRHRTGRLVSARVTASLIGRSGTPTHALLHVEDVSDELKAQAILKGEHERLGEIVDALKEISSSELHLDRLLSALVKRTVRLAGAGVAAVLLPEGDRMVVRAAAGEPSVPIGYSVPIAQSLAGACYRSGLLQRSSDALHDPRAHRESAQGAGLAAIISAPLVRNGVVIGVVQLMTGTPGGLDETDVRTLELITGFAAAAFDRAATTQRLLKSEQRTRAVIEAAPDPIVIFDSEGNAVDINPAAEAAFGRARADVIGHSAALLLAPRHVEAFGRWVAHGRDAGSAEYAGRRFETTGVRADGVEFPIEIAVANLPEDIQLGAAFLRDLTIRDQLRESGERLDAVISSAPVILIAIDIAGIITVARGRGLATFDLTPETTVGEDLREMVGAYPDAVDFITRALAGEAVSGQLHMTQSDRYVEFFFNPTRDDAGSVTGAAGVVTDVTDRVRGEEAVRQNEAKSRLMAMMNHEVRTPLNAILGFAHLLTDPRTGDLTDKQARWVGNIQAAGDHLLALVNESLDVAKLDAGKASVQLHDLPASALLVSAVEQVKPLADARRLAIDVHADADVRVMADERHLTQVVLNLLSNAIRHTPPGGSVTVSAIRAGDRTRIAVADTGQGIARDDLQRIFEEFYQAGNHAPGGVGLGLSISRRLVHLMGGSIEVQSELGRGSVFTVELAAR